MLYFLASGSHSFYEFLCTFGARQSRHQHHSGGAHTAHRPTIPRESVVRCVCVIDCILELQLFLLANIRRRQFGTFLVAHAHGGSDPDYADLLPLCCALFRARRSSPHGNSPWVRFHTLLLDRELDSFDVHIGNSSNLDVRLLADTWATFHSFF